jgi:2-polyprenyl-3-methyl-5-hydroxy-6-metoxy-1,4-benzoquinol methylase
MRYGIIPTNPIEWLALKGGAVPVPVIDALFSLMKARALMAGVRLGVFEGLRAGDRTPADLASALHVDADCLFLLLRTLVAFEYLVQRDDRYGLSSLSRESLIGGARMELFGYVEWNYTQWDLIEHLEDVVRTGRGVDFHSTLTDSQAWAHYQRGMLELAKVDAPLVAARVPVREGAATLLDLAGSHGMIGAAICRKHPPMRSIVIDLPQAVDHARPLARAQGIDDLVEHRAGDIMTSDLGSADVVVLSNILHHFKPPEIATLLARVRAATKPGGTVAIWEIEASDPAQSATAGDAVALFFRLTSTARAYHGSEYAAWLRTAGFASTRIARPMKRPGTVLITGRV